MKKVEQIEPSKLRRYFWEYAIIALAGAVVTLFYMFNDLNKYVRTKQEEIINRSIDALNKSTNATDQFLNYQKFKQ